MVICWILNSLSKDLAESFIYAQTSKQLWGDICESFELANGPLLYQLQHEIINLRQGSSSVSMYYNKLERL